MRGQFFLQLDEAPEAAAHWLRLIPGVLGGSLSSGSLEDAAAQSAGCQVIALVPSTDVFITQVQVPTQNRQRMLKAIPFALEDQLAAEVETLHFAVGREAEGGVTAAVVDRARMTAWAERLRQAGLQPDMLVPDVYALPTADQAWYVLPEGRRLLVRTGPASGFAADAENIQPVLDLALREAGEAKPQRLHALDGAGAANQPLLADDSGVSIESEPCDRGLLGVIAKNGFDAQSAINLLQGDYSRREQLGKLWRPWRLSIALVGVWLVIQLGFSVYDNIRLGREQEAIKQQVATIYKNVFPEAKQIVKPRERMERRLQELTGGAGAGSGFMPLLVEVSPQLKLTNGLNLRSLRYKGGVLDIDLEVPSLQVLDELKQRLAARPGLGVEIQSAQARGDKVDGRLQVRSSAP